MRPVQVEQAVARDPGTVAAFMFDPHNDAEWIRALTRVEVLTAGAVGPGTRVRRVARFLGRDMTYVLEVVAHDVGRRLAMRSVEGPFAMTVDYEVEPAAGGDSLVRITTTGGGGAFYKIAGPLLEAQVRRAIRGDLARLRDLLQRQKVPGTS